MASNSRLSKDKKLIKIVTIALVCVAICFAAGAATILYLQQHAPRLNTSSDADGTKMSFIMRPTPRPITDHGQLRTSFIKR